MGRECSPLLLHRTTLSEHVQTSGQPDAGRQPLSSAPGERGVRESNIERNIRERQRERKRGRKKRGIKTRTDKFKNGQMREKKEQQIKRKGRAKRGKGMDGYKD